jgi:ribonucleotide monophosphatase NagD (HAD superfamily)
MSKPFNVGLRWLVKYNCGMQAHPTAFVFDIDGTLVLNKKPIPGASRTLNFLNSRKIPFVLLTNNIAQSESSKAHEITNLLQLDTPLH